MMGIGYCNIFLSIHTWDLGKIYKRAVLCSSVCYTDMYGSYAKTQNYIYFIFNALEGF